MTDKLPYPELFPYLHPLQMIDIEKYPIIKSVVSEFIADHNYYLGEYLDTEKLIRATEYLQRYDLKETITNFDITDFKKAVEKLNIGRHKQEVWIVWVFVSAAFILINRAISENSIIPYAEYIKLCFCNAHDYKRLWHERKSHYKGANKTNKLKKQRKQEDLQTIAEELKKPNIADSEVFRNVKKIIIATKKRRPTFNKISSFTRNDSKNAITQAIETKK